MTVNLVNCDGICLSLKVIKITKTQVTLENGRRYSLKTGYEIGAHRSYCTPRIPISCRQEIIKALPEDQQNRVMRGMML